ncbi:MAG TPA: 5'-methylthioadenosine/S-adenosylhomocysteine nucleosidase [Candidatus Didemnitutus sp.]|nr:5'-methylthioadenosine/S-adenosylhomocysteine nucleosidase [Candidatus Didemnitutus sp.]
MIRRALLVFGFLIPALPGFAASVDALLVGATDAELKPVLAQLDRTEKQKLASWTFWSGVLGGHRVVVARGEGDPLNAVAATTLGIRNFSPRLVVVFGTARAHDPSLVAGDLVVAREFAAFDGMVSRVTPPDGGSDPTKWVALPHLLMAPDEKPTPQMHFPADEAALAIASHLHPPRGHLVVGVLGSANQVNREADRIAHLRALWGTSTEDFESAHVAGCARLWGVPAVGWCVVDGAEGEAGSLVKSFLEAWK